MGIKKFGVMWAWKVQGKFGGKGFESAWKFRGDVGVESSGYVGVESSGVV